MPGTDSQDVPQMMAKDSKGAELVVGDRVSIDKVGEGTVTAVEGDVVRIRVPGATPEQEGFNPREIDLWRVKKMTRMTAGGSPMCPKCGSTKLGYSNEVPPGQWGPMDVAMVCHSCGALFMQSQIKQYVRMRARNVSPGARVLVTQDHRDQHGSRLRAGQTGTVQEASESGGSLESCLVRWDDGKETRVWTLHEPPVERTARATAISMAVPGAIAVKRVGALVFDWWICRECDRPMAKPAPTEDGIDKAVVQAVQDHWLRYHRRDIFAAGATSMARATGYVYELEGGGDWRTAPDDSWETVVRTIDGRVVGTRRIDGAPVVVIEQGGTYYAVLQQNVSMSGSPRTIPRFKHSTTMAMVKARFIDDNTAQFKKGQIVYVDDGAIRRRDRRVWISEDPEGNRGAYGFPSDVELLSATAMKKAPARPPSAVRPGETATLNGRRGRILRRYHADGNDWLLVKTPAGDTLSWPAAEATARAAMSSTTATTMASEGAQSIGLPNGFSWMNGGGAMTFPIEPGRYSVTSTDKSQSPSTDHHGTFDSVLAAIHFAATLLPDKADYAYIWDDRRGFMVARGQA